MSLPQMRDAQMKAVALPAVGYATNADHGMGCNIHPAEKQAVSVRLAASAMAILKLDKTALEWRSPTYKAATPAAPSAANTSQGTASLVVELNDVSAVGLYTRHPLNYNSVGYGPAASQVPTVVDCFGQWGPHNASMTSQCAWAELEISGVGWVNSTVAIQAGGKAMVFTAPLPPAFEGAVTIVGSAYGYGPIPMLNVYDKGTDLPVLPWNRTTAHTKGAGPSD
jgi:hypothetical protein